MIINIFALSVYVAIALEITWKDFVYILAYLMHYIICYSLNLLDLRMDHLVCIPDNRPY